MNLQKAANSTHKTKRIGRGQGSGMGKTATKGGKGQTARKGYNEKRGFEGGQQPLQRRLPKVGFTSKFEKAYAINVEKVKGILELAEISFESIKSVHKFPKSVKKIKLIGVGAKELASKIKDKNISTSTKVSTKKPKKSEKTVANVAKAETPKTEKSSATKKTETTVKKAPSASKNTSSKTSTKPASMSGSSVKKTPAKKKESETK